MADPSYSIEGEWGEFQFKSIDKSDYPIIMKHIREVFCQSEPLLSTMGYTPELGNDSCTFVKLCLDKEDGLSFMAIHKASGKLAGIRVTHRKELKEENFPDVTLTSESTAQLLPNLLEISMIANVFERYGVDNYAELLIASVDPEFRERGLATEMYRRTFNLLRSKGYKITESNFTSPITRKVATKFGFEELVRRYFKDYKDENGKPFIHNAKDDQFSAYMVKVL